MIWDVLIIGGGPGGMQAAIAAASEGLTVLVVEKDKVGGQIGQTPKLENSVFANGGMTGPKFAKAMRKQAEAMGVVIQKVEVDGLFRRTGHDVISVLGSRTEFAAARVVILAMGNRWNDMHIPGMAEAVAGGQVKVGPVDCLRLNVEGKIVGVMGGGPSAGQAIIELARRGAKQVHVLLRSKLRMPQYLVDRIIDLDNVVLHENSPVTAVHGSGTDGVNIPLPSLPAKQNLLFVNTLFACNGLTPATDWLKGHQHIHLMSNGQVLTREAGTLQTHMDGVYAIGDCRAGSTARVGVAIGDGSMVVTEIWGKFLENPTCHNCKKLLS